MGTSRNTAKGCAKSHGGAGEATLEHNFSLFTPFLGTQSKKFDKLSNKCSRDSRENAGVIDDQ